MATNIGKYTLRLDQSPSIIGSAASGGKKEAEGPIGKMFDIVNNDALFGQKSWELAESEMQRQAAQKVLDKCSLSPGDIQFLFAGDLLNQLVASHYGLRELGIPFLGLYGACSTMAESLILSSMLIEGGLAKKVMAITSSHFCSAERQFRFPLEYGGQRTPTSQWTATAAGACIVAESSQPPYVKAVTVGCIEDKDIKDLNNMGAAMAPAASTTIKRYFQDTLTGPDNYDLILTGDLAQVGSDLLIQLLQREGYDIKKKHADCGLILYDQNTQDVHAGGSGCGCAASVLCSYIIPAIKEGKIKDMLFVATGALMSPISVQQGQNIPGIAHLLHLSSTPNPKQQGGNA
jgi:stage V sporulation protein AD